MKISVMVGIMVAVIVTIILIRRDREDEDA